MPHEDQYAKEMRAIAEGLDKIFNGDGERETGFVLLVFPFGEKEGRCNYISNGANRKDIICMFKEMIARFQGQPETKGNA